MTQKTSRLVTAEDYILWLGAQLRDEYDNSGKTYDDLIKVMFEKPFTCVIPMDENRMMDGMDLRVDFARIEHIRPTLMPMLGPCSFLEVLIGLSRRMAFIAGGQAPGWAWQLLCNIELNRMSDPLTRGKHRKAQEIMDTVIWRKYDPDGTGGFFPLTHSDNGDQTQIELWYQMNAYIAELHSEH